MEEAAPVAANHPIPLVRGAHEAIGPRMQAAGLNPDNVRTVILTHLDVDHVGGVGWFPRANMLVHRPEYEMASTFMGKMRYSLTRVRPASSPRSTTWSPRARTRFSRIGPLISRTACLARCSIPSVPSRRPIGSNNSFRTYPPSCYRPTTQTHRVVSPRGKRFVRKGRTHGEPCDRRRRPVRQHWASRS